MNGKLKSNVDESTNTICTMVDANCQTDGISNEFESQDSIFHKFMQTPIAGKTLWQILLQTPPQVFLNALLQAQMSVHGRMNNPLTFMQEHEIQPNFLQGFFPMFMQDTNPFAFYDP